MQGNRNTVFFFAGVCFYSAHCYATISESVFYAHPQAHAAKFVNSVQQNYLCRVV